MRVVSVRVRMDKYLANSGVGSRAEVKKLLKSGIVLVNDVVVKEAKHQIDVERDKVTVAGERVVYQAFIYLMMNKPQGVISATEDKHLPTVIDLLTERDQWLAPFPVGRLDRDTEGFLLITNDGQLAHQLLSPKKHVPKTYFARVEGIVNEDDIVQFEKGVALDDGYLTKKAVLVILNSGPVSEIELTITEGKFHQVKRMFAAVGKKVVYLKRQSMGGLKLDAKLALGEYRKLTDEELAILAGANV